MGFLVSLFVFSAIFSLVLGFPTTRPRHGLHVPPVINNCSGTTRPHLPNQIAAAPGYAPQLPSQGAGFEEWVIVVEGSVDDENPLIFARWGRGDTAAPDSNLENGIFAFFTNFDNGTTWMYFINGTLEYTDVGGVKTWALEDNKLTFDGTTGSWSYSISYPGFSFNAQIDMCARFQISISGYPAYSHTVHHSSPPPGTPFTPVLNGQPGLLSDQLYTRVEIPRGDISGNVTFPWGLTYNGLLGTASLKHVWSTGPMQDSVDSYVRGVTYLPETPSIQSVNWYQTIKDGKGEL